MWVSCSSRENGLKQSIFYAVAHFENGCFFVVSSRISQKNVLYIVLLLPTDVSVVTIKRKEVISRSSIVFLLFLSEVTTAARQYLR